MEEEQVPEKEVSERAGEELEEESEIEEEVKPEEPEESNFSEFLITPTEHTTPVLETTPIEAVETLDEFTQPTTSAPNETETTISYDITAATEPEQRYESVDESRLKELRQAEPVRRIGITRDFEDLSDLRRSMIQTQTQPWQEESKRITKEVEKYKEAGLKEIEEKSHLPFSRSETHKRKRF